MARPRARQPDPPPEPDGLDIEALGLRGFFGAAELEAATGLRRKFWYAEFKAGRLQARRIGRGRNLVTTLPWLIAWWSSRQRAA